MIENNTSETSFGPANSSLGAYLTAMQSASDHDLQGDFAKAEIFYQMAICINPSDSLAYTSLRALYINWQAAKDDSRIPDDLDQRISMLEKWAVENNAVIGAPSESIDVMQ